MASLKVEISDNRAILTLSDGDGGNRLNKPLLRELSAALDELEGRDDFRTVTLCSDGKMFSVGGALDEFVAANDILEYAKEVVPPWHKLIERLSALTTPLITAIQGPVLGAGNGLALTADVVIASETAFFCAAYSGIGVSPDLGTSWQIRRRGGATFATEFMLSNRRIGAQEALEAGLINEVVSPERLMSRAQEISELLAATPRASVAAIKRLMAYPGETLTGHLKKEQAEFFGCAATADAKEGITAFSEKRAPKFS